MKQIYFILIISIVFCGCFSKSKIEKSPTTQKKVLTKKLVHIVYLKTKSKIPEKEISVLKQNLLKLKNVEGVKNLKIGTKANTGDKRHFENYDIALQMEFDSLEALEIYAKDEFHLKIREKLKPYLAAPPIVFDYWVK